jgi:hypothetical protein
MQQPRDRKLEWLKISQNIGGAARSQLVPRT